MSDIGRNDHPEVQIGFMDGEMVKVDELMEELILALWSVGITTNYSCQGDPHFVDQTHYEAKRYRAYVQMKQDHLSVNFMGLLLEGYSEFRENHVTWDISFDRNPRTDEQRITIRFPQQEIPALVAFIEGLN